MTEVPIGYTEALGASASNPAEPRASGYPLGPYTVSSLELGIKAQFEQWVRRGALTAARDAEERGDNDDAKRLRSLYTSEFQLGYYSWGRYGRKIDEARGTYPGAAYLLFLLLRRCHPKITEEQASDMLRDREDECVEALKWAQGNSEPPAAKASPEASH